MKAKVQYGDLIGSVAADLSNLITPNNEGNIKKIGEYLNIDSSKYEVIGLSISGTNNLEISLLCIDKSHNESDEDYVVKISLNDKLKINDVFERLNIVLHEKFSNKLEHIKTFQKELNYTDL